MIAICEHTEKTKKEYEIAWSDLKTKLEEKGYTNDTHPNPSIYYCNDYLSIKKGYANTQYSGVLKENLANLSALQVAMLCDGGYSWFGGQCSKDGLKFDVKIYTD